MPTLNSFFILFLYFLSESWISQNSSTKMTCALFQIGHRKQGFLSNTLNYVIHKNGKKVVKLDPLACYCVIALLKTGTAIAIMTVPKPMSIASSVVIMDISAPRTMTFLRAPVT